jgi:hypothetical protein
MTYECNLCNIKLKRKGSHERSKTHISNAKKSKATKPTPLEHTILHNVSLSKNNIISKLVSQHNIPMLDLTKLILNEIIDSNIVNHIINNEKSIRKQLNISKNCLVFDTLKKIQFRMVNGVLTTKYMTSWNNREDYTKGRLYANKSISIQSLYHPIRHMICRDTYVDLDFVNCHPRILQQLTSEINTPCLDFYVNNRSAVLEETTKRKIIALINGDPYVPTDGFVNRFHTELTTKIYPHLCTGTDWIEFMSIKQGLDNLRGKYISKLMCQAERQMSDRMIEFFHTNGYMPNNIGISMYDGLMLWKETFPSNTSEQIKLLSTCADYINKHTSFNCEIAIKPMDKGLQLATYDTTKELKIPTGMRVITDDKFIQAQNKGLTHVGHAKCPTKSFDSDDIIYDEGDDKGRLSPFQGSDDLFIYAGMSAGKTHQCIKLLEKYNTIVWLSFRRSYTANVQGRLKSGGIPMESYLMKKYEKVISSDGTKVIIQSESLHKYDRRSPPDLLVIDECTTVMEQTHALGTHGNKYKANFETLMWMIKYAGRRIFMDANMDRAFVDEIKGIDKVAGRTSTNKLVVLRGAMNQRTTYMVREREVMFTWLKANSSKKLFIVSSSGVATTEALKNTFIEWGVTANSIMVYNSETPNSIKSHDFMHCNTEWLKYQIVITSPTIGAGVDFSVKNHFDHVVGLFSNRSCTVQTARQFMRRVRHPISRSFVHYKRTDHSDGAITIEAMDKYLSRKENAVIAGYDAYTFEFLKNGDRKHVHTLDYMSRIRFDIRRNISKKFFFNEFVEQETRAGTKIIYCGNNTFKKDDLDEFKTQQKSFKSNRIDEIAESKLLDNEQINEIEKRVKNGLDITPAERMSRQKYFLSKTYNIADDRLADPEWVKTYSDRGVYKHWYNLRKILKHDSIDESLKTIQEEERFGLHEIKAGDEVLDSNMTQAHKDRINRFWGQAVASCKFENHKWAVKFLNILGFGGVWRGDGARPLDLGVEVPDKHIDETLTSVNSLLFKDINVIKHVGLLFNKKTYSICKTKGFKTRQGMIRWLSGCV